MITYVAGDLFESPAKVLVNAVNTVGVMGKGVALTFKRAYPQMFDEYQRLCETGRFRTGQLWLYKTSHKWVLNFPTKSDWRRPSRLEYIELGLQKFVDRYAEAGITSVAFPRLGCGNGELDWKSEVEPLFRKYLAPLAIDVFVHHIERREGKPEHLDIERTISWLRSEPRSLSFPEVWADLERIFVAGRAMTLDQEGRRATVELVKGDEGGIRIRFTSESKGILSELLRVVTRLFRIEDPNSVLVPKESFLDLWQSIRTSGLLQPSSMPGGLDRLAGYLMPIFAELPYFKPVDLWTSRSPERQTVLVLREPTASEGPHQVRSAAIARRA